MWKDIIDFVSGIFKPASDLIDEVHTSEEEKLKLRNTLVELQNEVTTRQLELIGKQMDLEQQILEAKTSMMTAEAQSDSWLARSWRPITMLTFLSLIVLYALGLITLEARFAEDFMLLVQIGLGGYVVGRSAEKALPSLARSLAKRK